MPVPNCCQTSSTVDDFSGISVSSILSNLALSYLEHCILDRFSSYLTTSYNQFGFQKGLSGSNTVYSVRSVINSFVSGGSTVSVCAIDLSKAFDKMNRYSYLLYLCTV